MPRLHTRNGYHGKIIFIVFTIYSCLPLRKFLNIHSFIGFTCINLMQICSLVKVGPRKFPRKSRTPFCTCACTFKFSIAILCVHNFPSCILCTTMSQVTPRFMLTLIRIQYEKSPHHHHRTRRGYVVTKFGVCLQMVMKKPWWILESFIANLKLNYELSKWIDIELDEGHIAPPHFFEKNLKEFKNIYRPLLK